MKMIATLLTALVALLHTGFMAMEMFLWQGERVMSVFNTTPDFAAKTAAMAANQGLYNGFLAAGLVWALLSKKRDVAMFFLLCVMVAGIFGAITIKPTIFFVQAVPAILALIAFYLSKPKRA